jgi:hypothetical protein
MPRVKRPDPVRLWDHDLKCTTRRTGSAPAFPPQVPRKVVDDLLYRLKRITVGYLQQKELDTITKEINTRYRDEMKQMQFRDWNQTIDKISAELCEKDGWGSRMVKVSVDQLEIEVLQEIDWDETEQQHGPSTTTWCFWLSESLVPAFVPVDDAGSQLDSLQKVASLKTENEHLRDLLSQMRKRTKSLETDLQSERTSNKSLYRQNRQLETTLAEIGSLCSTNTRNDPDTDTDGEIRTLPESVHMMSTASTCTIEDLTAPPGSKRQRNSSVGRRGETDIGPKRNRSS